MGDVTVTSPLTPVVLNEAGMTSGAAAAATKQCKHTANDPTETRLGMCSPGCRDIWQLGQRSTHHFFLFGHLACYLCSLPKK